MRKNYVTIISLLIICIAAVIYAASSRNTQRDPQRLHAYVNPADLQSITIAQGKLSLELVPRGTEWYMQVRNSLIAVEADAMLKLLEFFSMAALAICQELWLQIGNNNRKEFQQVLAVSQAPTNGPSQVAAYVQRTDCTPLTSLLNSIIDYIKTTMFVCVTLYV